MKWMTLALPLSTKEEDIKKAVEAFAADPVSFKGKMGASNYADTHLQNISHIAFVKAYKGKYLKKDALKVVIEYDATGYNSWYTEDLISAALQYLGTPAIGSINHYGKKPNTVKTKTEREKEKAVNKAAKERVEKKVKDAKENGIEVTIPLELYKSNAGWRRGTTFVFRFYLGSMTINYEFYQSSGSTSGKWYKSKGGWPGIKNVEACTPLEFLVSTGMTLKEVLRERFKVVLPEDVEGYYEEDDEEVIEQVE